MGIGSSFAAFSVGGIRRRAQRLRGLERHGLRLHERVLREMLHAERRYALRLREALRCCALSRHDLRLERRPRVRRRVLRHQHVYWRVRLHRRDWQLRRRRRCNVRHRRR